MDSSPINQRARKVFTSSLPDNWIHVEEYPDEQHIDFRVHFKENGKPTGLDFSVQLKGKRRLDIGRRGIPFPVDGEHLEYWLERHRRPVFLVVVDVKSEQAFWLSLEEWNRHGGNAWREKKRRKVTLHIPIANTLRNTERLLAAVRHADELVCERNPGSVAAAAANERDRLTRMDPRFDYEFRNDDGMTQIVLHPKEPVAGALSAIGRSASNKLTAAVGTGVPVDFDPGELRFEGEGIFALHNKHAADLGISIQLESRIPCEFSIQVVDSSGSVTTELHGLRCELVGGRRERRYEAHLGTRLVSLSGTMEVIDDTGRLGLGGRFTLLLDFGEWMGQRILSLPYFDRILRFFERAQNADEIRFSVEVTGRAAHSPLPRDLWKPLIDNLAPRVAFIDRARLVARHLGVNPPLPDLDVLEREEIENVFLLADAIQVGAARRCGKGRSLSGTMTLDRSEPFEVPTDPETWLFAYQEPTRAQLFGEPSKDWVRVDSFKNFASSPKRVGEFSWLWGIG